MQRKKFRFHAVMLLCALLISASACSAGGESQTETPMNGTLKILYYDENSFNHQLGDLLYSKFPDMEFEIIDRNQIWEENKEIDPEESLIKVIEEKQPDIIMTYSGDYRVLAEKGLLLDLETYITKDQFDIENMLPGVIELLKEQGQGKLYGLAPQFNSQALFYNKDLFDQHQVPYPQDSMSWEEVLQLAARFPTDGESKDRIYGYASMWNSASNLALYTIGSTESLSYVDYQTQKMTLDSPEWRRVIDMVIEGYTQGYIAPEFKPAENNRYGPEEIQMRDLFGSGRAAMTIENLYFFDRMSWEKIDVNWDLVTQPVDADDRNNTNGYYVNEVYSVYANSPNTDAAWEVVKYLNSDTMAKIKSKTDNYMTTRTSYLKEKDGRSLEPFYKLGFAKQEAVDHGDIPMDIGMKLNPLIDAEFQALLNGTTTTEEALKKLQEEGQVIIDQAIAEEKSKSQTSTE